MDWNITIYNKDGREVPNTNIVVGTTAPYAYNRYLAKKRQIEELKYECDILVDKYYSEMNKANIPFQFNERALSSLFDKNKKIYKIARQCFLEQCFSDVFLKKFPIKFLDYQRHGYGRTAFTVILGIGDYHYFIEIPLPSNINDKDDKKRLMGQVMFRADKIHKSKKDAFFKEMESVQMPTYDWKECFNKIEEDVMVEFVKGNEKKS